MRSRCRLTIVKKSALALWILMICVLVWPRLSGAQVDYVTGSNNEDGVAQVIERFIL